MKKLISSLLLTLLVLNFNINTKADIEHIKINYKDYESEYCKLCDGNFVTQINLFTGEVMVPKTIDPKNSECDKHNVLVNVFCSCYGKMNRRWTNKSRVQKFKFPNYSKSREKFSKLSDEQFKLMVNFNKAHTIIYIYKQLMYRDMIQGLKVTDDLLGKLPFATHGYYNASADRQHMIDELEEDYVKNLTKSIRACLAKDVYKDLDLRQFVAKFVKTERKDFVDACFSAARSLSKYFGNEKYITKDDILKMSNPVKKYKLDHDLGVVKDFIYRSKYLSKMAKEAFDENKDLPKKSQKFELKSVKKHYEFFAKNLKSRKIDIKELTAQRVILEQDGVDFEVSFTVGGQIKEVNISENPALMKLYGEKNRDVAWAVKAKYVGTMNVLKANMKKALFNGRLPAKEEIKLSEEEVASRAQKAEDEKKEIERREKEKKQEDEERKKRNKKNRKGEYQFAL
ncbi:hypothetical protein AAEX28_06045 [Lentisphaerota bacterium WC36G]|nr:hypothetical protein LJT99_08905 [Lentisphaerae bacterium WC36]